MNETLKTIAERHSCRDYTDAQLTDEQINAIVEAALAAPSAMDRQPWRLIVIKEKAVVDELDAYALSVLASAEDKGAYERVMSRGGKLFYNAPCMILVLSDGSAYATIDSGILVQNIALAAHALGLGSVICGMAAIPLSGSRADEMKKKLQFPDGFAYTIGILLGNAKSGKTPHAKDFGKVKMIGA